ncbi:hypothetical protein [Christensenella timonensis]|uniref:hypothetical protein n=1 Tax=Christensenella timonensis TaxID=1816678 RepID=UPI0011C82E5E|nr:hypothetical protein [Christensenella timonensis]
MQERVFATQNPSGLQMAATIGGNQTIVSDVFASAARRLGIQMPAHGCGKLCTVRRYGAAKAAGGNL